jgi:hypothetical protein
MLDGVRPDLLRSLKEDNIQAYLKGKIVEKEYP